MIFRLSQKLSDKIKTGTLAAHSLDKNPLADWSARLFLANRTQHIMLTNTKSLYSAVMIGKGVANENEFIQRALSNIRELMEAVDLEFIYHQLIVPASSRVVFAKALNRTITGSMNEFIKYATYFLAAGDISLFDVGFRLNDTPMSALAFEGSAYGIPREVFKRLTVTTKS